MKNLGDSPRILLHWEEVVNLLLRITQKFPKSVRFSVVRHIQDEALSILGDLVEARLDADRLKILKRAGVRLEKLRLLLRISFEQKWLSTKAFEAISLSLNIAGKMLGGWIKHSRESIDV